MLCLQQRTFAVTLALGSFFWTHIAVADTGGVSMATPSSITVVLQLLNAHNPPKFVHSITVSFLRHAITNIALKSANTFLIKPC